MLEQIIANGFGGFVGIVVGAAKRLGNDLINQPELEQMFGRNFQRLGGFRCGRGSARTSRAGAEP